MHHPTLGAAHSSQGLGSMAGVQGEQGGFAWHPNELPAHSGQQDALHIVACTSEALGSQGHTHAHTRAHTHTQRAHLQDVHQLRHAGRHQRLARAQQLRQDGLAPLRQAPRLHRVARPVEDLGDDLQGVGAVSEVGRREHRREAGSRTPLHSELGTGSRQQSRKEADLVDSWQPVGGARAESTQQQRGQGQRQQRAPRAGSAGRGSGGTLPGGRPALRRLPRVAVARAC